MGVRAGKEKKQDANAVEKGEIEMPNTYDS